MDSNIECVPASDARGLVDEFILDRAPRLSQMPVLWNTLKPLAHKILGYEDAVKLVEAVRNLDADACFEWGDQFLNLNVEAVDLERVPDEGPCLIIANHPGGIADGNALWKVIRDKRSDLIFFANRDALKIVPGLAPRIIPVEWRKNKLSRQRARETLRSAMEAFNAGRCVVIFPAGRMADWSWRKWQLVDPDWAPTGVSIARRFNAPIIPMGVTQRMPLAYYVLSQIHEELRDITLFHGLMNQKGKSYRLRFGLPHPARDLPGTEVEATAWLKTECDRLAWT